MVEKRKTIQIKDCKKEYNTTTIFSGLNYLFCEGTIYWLLGKNGTGKSVFLRCLSGLETFSGGDVEGDLGSILYLPETPLGEGWLTVRENIDLMLYYYRIRLKGAEMEEIMEKLKLKEEDSLVSQVSAGTAMKAGLFLIFLKNKWNTIILDETLSHIDSEMKVIILRELKKRKEEGTIIFLTNHGELQEDAGIQKIWLESDGISDEKK